MKLRAAELDRLADRHLSENRHDQAERLSHQAAEMRGDDPMLPGFAVPTAPVVKAIRARIVRKAIGPKTASGRTKKGARTEREIAALGIKASRQPLSGALQKHLGAEYGGDLKIWIFGDDLPPVVAEVKSRAAGGGFVTLEKWLGGHDVLILKRNGVPPMVVLPWATWAKIVRRVGGA